MDHFEPDLALAIGRDDLKHQFAIIQEDPFPGFDFPGEILI